jgi:hypothetical protein
MQNDKLESCELFYNARSTKDDKGGLTGSRVYPDRRL